MATLIPCPARHDLQQFLLGHGDADAAAVLSEHLSDCPACAAASRHLPAEDELVSTVRRAAAAEDTPDPESVASLVSAFRLAARERDPNGTVSWAGVSESVPDPAPAAPAAVARIGGYEVSGVLGAGGMGVVYHGYDPVLRREVAIKVMKREWHQAPAALDRMLAEARAVAAVEHDNIVGVFAVATHDGLPCLVMPLLKGEPLAARLGPTPGPPLPPPHLLALASDVLSGLAAAHARGLIHRDIKPANLWVESGGGFGRVKILDFGLAGPRSAGTGLGGTPGFMPPEQVRGGAIDGRADLFALGCVLYRAATGRMAFEGITPTDCLVRTITRDPRPVREWNRTIPPRLAEFIGRLLSKEPAGRPESAASALAEVNAIADEATARRKRITRRAWIAGVAAAGVLGGLAAWLLVPPAPADQPPVAVTLTADPDITKLVLSRDGREQVVELPKGGKLSLVPGEWTVRLPAEVPGRKLEPASFTVLPGTSTAVTLSLPGEVAVSKAHSAAVTGVAAVTRDKKLVVLSASLDRTLTVWLPGTADDPVFANLTSPARAFAATPDGKLVVTAGGNKQQPFELGVQLWDGPALKAQRLPLEGHTRQVTVLAAAADGSRVVSASAGEVFLRTLAVQRREELVGHGEAKVTAAAVDADGKLALTGDDAGFLAVWDATTAREVKKVVAQSVGAVGAVRAVGFTPKGFASAGDDGVVRVWDRTTFEARELTAKPKAKPLLCLAVSADGTHLLTGGADGAVVLWSVAEGKVLATLSGHQGAVNAVGFTPDGRNAVSGGDDRTVRLWRLPLPAR